MSKGKVTEAFIRNLISSIDIVEVVSRYLQLKKTGKNWSACCPFHSEKTPSFSVSPEKQIYYCFGCHEAGDSISFIKNHEHTTFVEAIEILADIAGMDVEYQKNSSNSNFKPEIDTDALYQASSLASYYFQYFLRQHKTKNIVIDYIKSRGISGKTAQIFQIGYAPNSWEELLLLIEPKFPKDILLKAGLISLKNGTNNKYYDYFRDRLIFPIRNKKGKTIGFGGRSISQNNQGPKYLNSPESPIFYKHSTLYGLYELLAKSKPNQILVVEGYMDVVALWEHGYYSSVATLGTAFTSQHIKILFREVKDIVLCFDGDSAGQQAALKSLHIILPMLNENRYAKFLILPQGEDPDSFITKNGLASLNNEIKNSLSATDFLIDSLKKNKNLQHSDDLAKFLLELKNFFENVDNETYLISILATISRELNIPLNQLTSMMKIKKTKTESVDKKRFNVSKPELLLAEKIIRYLLCCPEAIKKMIEAKNITIQAHTELHEIIIQILSEIKQAKTISTALLIQLLQNKYSKYNEYFYQMAKTPLEFSEDKVCIEFEEALILLEKETNTCYYALIEKSKFQKLSVDEQAKVQKSIMSMRRKI